MTQQVIDIGAAPDDSTGDPLRLSFDKTNENFTELYAKGATEGLWNYNKTSTDTTTAPVSGRFKTNSGNYRDATQIAINAITIQGIDRSSTLRTLLVGDLIQCQDSTNSAAWCRYSLQSLPVDHGTWFQLNVTFQADGGVASGDNQEIVFVFTASSGSAAVGAPVGAEYITSTTNATLTAERVLTDTATVTWDRTTAGQIKANGSKLGVTNGSNAAAGEIGEYVQSVIQSASAANGVSGAWQSFILFTLTAGDWDVSATSTFIAASAPAGWWSHAAEVTTNSSQGNGTQPNNVQGLFPPVGASSLYPLTIPPVRFSLAATTNIFLQVFQNSGISLAWFGAIHARRVR